MSLLVVPKECCSQCFYAEGSRCRCCCGKKYHGAGRPGYIGPQKRLDLFKVGVLERMRHYEMALKPVKWTSFKRPKN